MLPGSFPPQPALVGQFVPCQGAMGIDYALTGMFICLLVFQLRGRIYIITSLLAATSLRCLASYDSRRFLHRRLCDECCNHLLSAETALPGAGMTSSDYLILFAGMGLATYLPRALPLLYLANKKMPQWLIDWLELIPVSILSTLLAPSLFVNRATRHFAFGKLELLVALPTLLFALKTRSLGGTVLVGMLLYWLGGMIY
ncbi:MAG: AzlD domain-containing protein [Syntrophotaleaceae bacterium]